MDYTEFPEDNLDCGEYNFNLLHDLYGNGERRMLRTPMSETRTLSEELLEEYRVAVQEISQDSSCSYCILDLSNGYRVFVHKLLV